MRTRKDKLKSKNLFPIFNPLQLGTILKRYFLRQVEVKGDFLYRVVMVEELFAYIFGIYIKFGYKNPSILTPCDSVDVAT